MLARLPRLTFITKRIISSPHRNIASMPAWSRLIRFIAAEDGKEYQGEPVIPSSSSSDFFDIGKNADGLKAKIITGDIYTDCVVTEEQKTVKRLLSPVSKSQITLIRCVGLNYLKHSERGSARLLCAC